VLAAANVLWDYQSALLADLADGTAGTAWDSARTKRPLTPLSEEVASELSGLLQPQPELAAELKEVGRANLTLLLGRPCRTSLYIVGGCIGSTAAERQQVEVVAGGYMHGNAAW
jgi:hypothetical protein